MATAGPPLLRAHAVGDPDRAHLARVLASVGRRRSTTGSTSSSTTVPPTVGRSELLAEAAAADPRVRVIHRRRNGGVVAAAATLWPRAGELIAVARPPTTFAPDALAAMDAAFTDRRRRRRLQRPRRPRPRRSITSSRRSSPTSRPSGCGPTTTSTPSSSLAATSPTRSAASTTATTAPRTTTSSCAHRAGPPCRPRAARSSTTATVTGRVRRCGEATAATAAVAAPSPTTAPASASTRRRADPTTRAATASSAGSPSEPLVSVVIPTRGTSGRVWGATAATCRGGAQPRRTLDLSRAGVRRRARRRDTRRQCSSALAALPDAATTLVPYDAPFNFSAKINLGVAARVGRPAAVAQRRHRADRAGQRRGARRPPADARRGDGRRQAAVRRRHAAARRVTSTPSSPTTPASGGGAIRPARGRCGRSPSSASAAASPRPARWCAEPPSTRSAGFATELPLNYNDVDFCLKLRAAGHRIVWTPWAVWYHFESRTRVSRVLPEELAWLDARWHAELTRRSVLQPQPRARRHDFLELPPPRRLPRQEFVMTTESIERCRRQRTSSLLLRDRIAWAMAAGVVLLAGTVDEAARRPPRPRRLRGVHGLPVVVLAVALALTLRRGAILSAGALVLAVTPAALAAVAAASACGSGRRAGGVWRRGPGVVGPATPRRRQRRSACRRGRRRRRVGGVDADDRSDADLGNSVTKRTGELLWSSVGSLDTTLIVPDHGLADLVGRRRARGRSRARRRRRAWRRCDPARRGGDDRGRVAA